jgi:hypothetical protein
MSRIQNYNEFWLFYLREHSRAATRNMHYLGTTIGLLFFATALLTLNAKFILAGLFSGYFFAWISHFFVEKNRPATFKYPFWSFYSDFRMYFLFISGRLPAHLQAAGVNAKVTA